MAANNPLLPGNPITVEGILGPEQSQPSAESLLGPDPAQGDLVRGTRIGFKQLKAAAGGVGALLGRATKIKPLEQFGTEVARTATEEATALAKPTDDVTQVKSIGDAVDFAGYALGSAFPSILASVAGGGFGALAGRAAARGATAAVARKFAETGALSGLAAASVAQEAGGIGNEVLGDEKIDNPVERALLGGLAAGSLDVLPLLRVGKRLGLVGDKLAGGVVPQTLTGKAKAVGLEGLKQAGFEGATEVAQTAIERAAANKDLDSPEAIREFLNAGAVGALAGGAFGGAGEPFALRARENEANRQAEQSALAAEQLRQQEAAKVKAEGDQLLAGLFSDLPPTLNLKAPADTPDLSLLKTQGQTAGAFEQAAAKQAGFDSTRAAITQAAEEAGIGQKPELSLAPETSASDALPFTPATPTPEQAAARYVESQRVSLKSRIDALEAELQLPANERRTRQAITVDLKTTRSQLATFEAKTPEATAALISSLSVVDERDQPIPATREPQTTPLTQGQVLDFGTQPPADPRIIESPLALDTLQSAASGAPGFDRSARENAVLNGSFDFAQVSAPADPAPQPIVVPAAGTKPRSRTVFDRAGRQAEDTALALEAQRGSPSRSASVADGQLLGEAPVDPTAANEIARQAAQAKRDAGQLLSSAEVKALRLPGGKVAQASPIEVVTSRSRETRRQGTPAQKREAFQEDATRVIDSGLNELVTAGVLKDRVRKSVTSAVKRAVDAAAKENDVVAARRALSTFLGNALKGKVDKVDADIFIDGVTTQIENGEASQVFFSKAPVTQDTSRMVANAAGAAARHGKQGGQSLSVKTGIEHAGAQFYTVSVYKASEQIVPGAEITQRQIDDFVRANAELLSNDNHVLGSWYNKENGFSYLDVSILVPDLQSALALAAANDQLAVFDLRTFTEITRSHPLFDVAQLYNHSVGLPAPQRIDYILVDPDLMTAIAEAYQALDTRNTDPATAASYAALAAEVEAQYVYASREIAIEPWTKPGQPYATSAEMRKDAFENKHLYVFAGNLEHPSLSNEQNFKFRAVHDLFGHARTGFEFGPRGELNATRAHAQMFSEVAIPALVTETVGQNSFVNFSAQNANLPAAERPFAEQKADLLPESLWRPLLEQSLLRRSDAFDTARNIAATKGSEVIAYLQKVLGAPEKLDIRIFRQTDSSGPAGRFRKNPIKDIIELAYNQKDVLSTAAHEAFHYIEERVLSAQERAILNRGFAKGSRLQKLLLDKIAATYADERTRTTITDEVRAIRQESHAYGFEFWKRGEFEVDGPIARIFQKLAEMFERVRNFVSGLGFTSVEDVYRAIDAGAYAQRQAPSVQSSTVEGVSDFFSRAPIEVEQRMAAGEMDYNQMLAQVGAALDRETLPDPTVQQLLGAKSSAFGQSVRDAYLKHFASGEFTARLSNGYKNVNAVLSAYRARKNRLIATSVEVGLSRWLKGSAQSDIASAGRALLERTVGSHRSDSPEYMQIVGRLNESQRGLFEQANKTIGELLDQEFIADQAAFARALKDDPTYFEEWRENRAVEVARLKAEGYVPERRYGDNAVHITIEQAVDGKIVPLTLFFETFETKAEAIVAQQQYQQILATVAPDLKIERGEKFKAERDASLSYQQFLDTARRNGIQFSQAERERLAKALISADSLRRNRIFRRKNVPGFSTDALRILSEFAVGISNKIAYGEFSDAINSALDGKKVDAVVEASGPTINIDENTNLWKLDGPNNGFFRNLANTRSDYVLVKQSGAEAVQTLRMAASLHFLGGSFAAGMVQLSSLAMNTTPFLHQHTSYTDATGKVTSALKDVTQNLSVLRNLDKLENRQNRIEAIDSVAGLRDALIRAGQDGTTLDTELYQIMGLTRGGLLAKSNNVRRAVETWMAPFRITEQINRSTTFIAAYKIGQAKNLQGQDLYKFAQDAVYRTQFKYDEVNRPSITQTPLGALLFTFKSYPLFMGELIYTLYREKPAAATVMLLSLAVAAGIEGLPFAEDIEDLIDVISQRIFGSPFNSKRALRNVMKTASEAITGADFSDLLLHGAVNSLTGLSFASRVGLGNLVPGTRLGAADSDYSQLANEAFGPVGSLVAGAVKGTGSLLKGDFIEAARTAAPLAAQNVIKGAQQFSDGFASDIGGKKLIDVTGIGAFAQTIGFSSASLGRAYELDRIDKQTAAFYNEAKRDFTNDIIKAVRDGDTARVREAVEAVQAWNRSNPQYPIVINGSTVRRDLQLSAMPLNQRTLLTLPRALRGTSEALNEIEGG